MMTGRMHGLALNAAVFVCGAVVMVYEIIGSRLVAPYIGTSVYVWTSLIGVILASLSLGYWLGGRLADKAGDVRLLASVVFAAGGLISVTTLIKDVILSTIASVSTGLELKALFASLVLFAPASILLGMVTPLAVRLSVPSIDRTGRTVGSLYALSTIGSIVGTFAAGFFLIPFVGSVRTLYLIAALLFAVAIMLAPLKASRTNITAIVLFVFGIAASEAVRLQAFRTSGLVDLDTQYSRVQVLTTEDPATSRPIRALATDPYFAQSAMFLDSDDLVFPYSRYYRLIGHFGPGPRRVLMIGGGGFSYPKEFVREFPAATIDVVEIDPGVTRLAREYFRLRDDPRMKIVHEDGRSFLNAAPAGEYDAVLIDAFGSLFSVPFHLTTLEAVRQIECVLARDGLVIANVGSAIEGDAGRFLRAELATYRSVFPQVHVFKVRPERADTDLQNVVIVATNRTEPLVFESGDRAFSELLARRYTENISHDQPVLTDDLAPVEFYGSVGISHFLSEQR
jgi:spermidine synthase